MDRITSLPDDLLCRILSFLPTKQAVATSILSSRWIKLWTLLPVLDFSYSLCGNRQLSANDKEKKSVLFSSFVSKVLSHNHSPEISKFRLRIHVMQKEFFSFVNSWIQSVALRNLVELDLQVTSTLKNGIEYGLLEIPPCVSLQVLKISGDWHLLMPSFGCFPNLKIFYFNYFPQGLCQGIPLNLLPSLPQLEKLCLFLKPKSNIHLGFSYNISGNALKSVNMLIGGYAEPHEFNIVIDTPRLEYLHLKDGFVATYSLKNLPPVCEVKLDLGGSLGDYLYQRRANASDRVIKLLQGISKAKSLFITANTLQVLHAARNKVLPVFLNLTELKLVLYPGGWNLLLHWLDSCPNLKFLSLTKQEGINNPDLLREQNWSEPEDVPSCLLFHLEELEISRLSSFEEKKVFNYLLENAKVLKHVCWNVSLS